jgi:membrane protein YdbS with pleckstrin-like domain
MSKLDEIKETLNTLRAMLAVISAFLIALGTAVGSLFIANNINIAFWIAILFMVLFVIVGFLIMIKIIQKTKAIGDL